VGRAGPGPQLGWAVPDMGRAKNCVLWVGLLGTTQMYTYSPSAKSIAQHFHSLNLFDISFSLTGNPVHKLLKYVFNWVHKLLKVYLLRVLSIHISITS
jgi:hypothetical protein